MDECGGAYGLMLRCLSLLSNALRSQSSSRLQSMAKKSKALLKQPEAGPSRRDVTPDEDEEVDNRFTQQFSDNGHVSVVAELEPTGTIEISLLKRITQSQVYKPCEFTAGLRTAMSVQANGTESLEYLLPPT